jgi:hypothetical protein
MSDDLSQIKQFAMNNQLLEHNLDTLEQKYRIDLGRSKQDVKSADTDYYPQIEEDIRHEAASMAPHYEVFYSLEKTIRRLIGETLEAAESENWWQSKRISKSIRDEAKKSQQREIDSGVTPRSQEEIDYCTFGELGEIIKQNWDLFGSIFTSVKAVQRVMNNLNTLRGPIAHCSPLADDEVVRLRLAVRDWFRIME